jgi:hypothetical protein
MDTKKLVLLLVVGLMVAAFATGAIAASACKTVTTTNNFNAGVATFTMNMKFCYSGGKITSYSTSSSWGTKTSWVYRGITETDNYGGVGKSYVSVEKTALFKHYMVGMEIGHRYLWNTIYAKGDGSWSSSKGSYL